MALTASLPPLITEMMPSGTPASSISSPRSSGQDGSFSDGFRMKALPQAMASGAIQSGIMAGKLKGVMPAEMPDRVADGQKIDAGADIVAELALHQLRDAAGELDHLEAAGDRALGVVERLAVLGGDQAPPARPCGARSAP